MKKIIFIMLSLFVTTFLNADVVKQNGEKDGYKVSLYTKNTPISGNNEFFVKLFQNDSKIEDYGVKKLPEHPFLKTGSFKSKVN